MPKAPLPRTLARFHVLSTLNSLGFHSLISMASGHPGAGLGSQEAMISASSTKRLARATENLGAATWVEAPGLFVFTMLFVVKEMMRGDEKNITSWNRH